MAATVNWSQDGFGESGSLGGWVVVMGTVFMEFSWVSSSFLVVESKSS